GKMTLAVRLGDTAARWSYPIMLTVAVAAPLFFIRQYSTMAGMLFLLVISIRPSILMIEAKDRNDLIPVLKMSGLFSILYALLFTVGVILYLCGIGEASGSVGVLGLGVVLSDFIAFAEFEYSREIF